MKPEISIIIRTYNEERLIETTIRKVEEQTPKHFEIIVLDSESTDKTLKIIKKLKKEFPNIRLLTIKQKEFSFGRAINIGIENAQAKYCVLISGHSPPVNNQWLYYLKKAINEDSNIAGVYGKQIPFADANPVICLSEYTIFGDKRKEITHKTKEIHFSNANSIINKEIWNKVKFNEVVPGAEDALWAKEVIQLGFKLIYEPKSIVYHSHNETLDQIKKRNKINYYTYITYMGKKSSKLRIIISTFLRIIKDIFHLIIRKRFKYLYKSIKIRYVQMLGRLEAYEKK